MTSKAERVAEEGPDFFTLSFVKGQVQPGVDIRIVGKMVDSRRHKTVVDGQHMAMLLYRPSTPAMASIAPAAPSKCPVMDLVELMWRP